MAAQPTPSPAPEPTDEALEKARSLLVPCTKSDSVAERRSFAKKIAALWPDARPDSRRELGAIYAKALGAVAALVDDADEAQQVAGRIGGLLAMRGLRTEEIAREYAKSLFHAATFLSDPWERGQRAADIEDLIEEGAPYDHPAIALSYAQLVYATTLIESDETRLLEGLARLERMALGKSAARGKVVSPELGYELAKVILIVAMRCDVDLIEGRRDDVRRLVSAANASPGAEFDEWLTQFASVEHAFADFAIELLGMYRAVRDAAEQRPRP